MSQLERPGHLHGLAPGHQSVLPNNPVWSMCGGFTHRLPCFRGILVQWLDMEVSEVMSCGTQQRKLFPIINLFTFNLSMTLTLGPAS